MDYFNTTVSPFFSQNTPLGFFSCLTLRRFFSRSSSPQLSLLVSSGFFHPKSSNKFSLNNSIYPHCFNKHHWVVGCLGIYDDTLGLPGPGGGRGIFRTRPNPNSCRVETTRVPAEETLRNTAGKGEVRIQDEFPALGLVSLKLGLAQ